MRNGQWCISANMSEYQSRALRKHTHTQNRGNLRLNYDLAKTIQKQLSVKREFNTTVGNILGHTDATALIGREIDKARHDHHRTSKTGTNSESNR